MGHNVNAWGPYTGTDDSRRTVVLTRESGKSVKKRLAMQVDVFRGGGFVVELANFVSSVEENTDVRVHGTHATREKRKKEEGQN